ncbi:MAG: methyltransferase family protein [Candidatus Njordarchaeia archaeon]
MDKLKRRVIYWGLLFVILLAFSIIVDHIFNFVYLQMWWRLVGVIIIILSGLLLHASGRTLRKYGLTDPTRFGDTDKLVTVGIYSCIRHPHHLGIALFALGFGLALGSITYLAVGVPIMWIAVYWFVKKIEEPEALEKFGDAYKTYIKEVPAFIPWKGCKRNLSI